jgi:Icc-related predicted phosphoesterase
MRIVAISDLHGWLPEIPSCDLLLIAGDICPDFRGSANPALRRSVAERQGVWLRDVFAAWLETQSCGHAVLCWGNHDYAGELPASSVPKLAADVLTDQESQWNGFRIYATPWTFFAPRIWAFDVTLPELAHRMARIPDGIDILITHGPPYGVLDRTADGDLAGSRSLGDAVRRVRPRLHVFGHIHEGRGCEGSSYNVAVKDARYEPYALPVTVIELEF